MELQDKSVSKAASIAALIIPQMKFHYLKEKNSLLAHQVADMEQHGS
ncbi:hypothetical protein Cpin_0026 [Chitinophaga pinensis DSM 2588]|uniref:Uncharacterized protein n=1 Tax=Chitinophaga pinensis (strain ATCC 43595 / DSM 2588 / LMG 13176 / NBRC 15968 / NCIMB 11800 / UQM 2034) TaxID=485918 RepID=A0A979FYM5_CHIPD|nr:hypothetical protein Cpin_0026 [Chitinophaga pinensis DSM 2588]